jgi:hypothetical protein
MNFANEMTNAVSSEDENHLITITLIARCLRIAHSEQKKKNPHWKHLIINCHSISRLISLFLTECRLVDGYLIGLQIDEGEGFFKVQHTCHSWIETPDKNIIDPYPMGIVSIGTAIVVPRELPNYQAHGYNLYREHPEVRDHFDERKSWKSALSFRRILQKNCSEEMIKRESNFLAQI